MVDWQEHFMYGAGLSVVFVFILKYLFGWYETSLLATIIVLLISPLVPDLDHPMGKLHQWVMTLGFLIAGIGIVGTYFKLDGDYTTLVIVGAIIAGVTFFNAIWTSHRGFWHSIPMALIYGAIVFWVAGLQLGILAAFGFWTHLLFDEIPFKIK